MAMTSTRWVLLVSLLGPNTVAGAMGVPVMTIGVKRYTNTLNRGFAFSLFYTLMNVAALSQVRWCFSLGGRGMGHLTCPPRSHGSPRTHDALRPNSLPGRADGFFPNSVEARV